jgi:hypothetical protein
MYLKVISFQEKTGLKKILEDFLSITSLRELGENIYGNKLHFVPIILTLLKNCKRHSTLSTF